MSEQILTVAANSASNGIAYSGFLIFSSLVFVVIAAIHFYYKSQESYKLAMRIPGPDPLPIFGNALMALGKTPTGNNFIRSQESLPFSFINNFALLNISEIVTECLRLSEVYGRIARGFLGYKVAVFLTDPRDVEKILNSNVHLTKSSEYRFFKPWLGDGLLISNGEKWRSHRKLIAPAFHQLVLKSFIGAFNRNSLKLVKRMRKEIGNEFDVHDYMSEVTVDILLGRFSH